MATDSTIQAQQSDGSSASNGYALSLGSLRRSDLDLVGGKAANLGELVSAGLPVPPGFCLTTGAYEAASSDVPGLADLLGRIEGAAQSNLPTYADQIRQAFLTAAVPPRVATAVLSAYRALGEDLPVAVRSSATAEDLPGASFAGQQDTFLNVVGEKALLEAVRACWASLWTDRAVSYRAAQEIDQRSVRLAVVVQRLVPAAWAGVLFTADPVSGRRDLTVVDASPGLGEAVVSGAVDPDRYVVDRRERLVVTHRPGAATRLVIQAREGGGTDRRLEPVGTLPEARVLDLADLGERIERHYGGEPQDVEWAVDRADRLWILQARPITSLFPVPEPAPTDGRLHVYVSANVFQGVLGPFSPMGMDVYRRLFRGALRNGLGIDPGPPSGSKLFGVAAGRLYPDVTGAVRTRLARRMLLTFLGVGEPRSAIALRTALDDPRFSPAAGSDLRFLRGLARVLRRYSIPQRVLRTMIRPSRGLERVRQRMDAAVARAGRPGPDPVANLRAAERLLDTAFPTVIDAVAPVMLPALGSLALAHHIAGPAWQDDVPLLARGIPHNPTTEMDLALGMLARRWGADPAMRDLFDRLTASDLAAALNDGRLPPAFVRELEAFLDRWGMRGVAEIDIGIPRWRDDPTPVLGMIANVARAGAGLPSPVEQFADARREAEAAIDRIASALPFPRRLLFRIAASRVRVLLGARELPKFSIVRLFALVRERLQAVGSTLAAAGRIEAPDDVFFLTFAECEHALAGQDLRAAVAERKESYRREQGRRFAPRVVLSNGQTFDGEVASNDPRALVGVAASPGSYEGVVRVVLDPHGAHLAHGEVLVAPSTDPGWTPLFLTAGALVMEMGGMMSHGAVVAREYGIPAVVGLSEATTRLRSGQRVRVDGAAGTVTVLEHHASEATGAASSPEAGRAAV